MKLKRMRIAPAALLLCACALFGCVSCALTGGEYREVHTMFEGTGTLAPETVIVTVPTVITVPVGPAETSAAPAVPVTDGPAVTAVPVTVTEAPVTTEAPAVITTCDYEVVTVSEVLGASGTAKSTKTLRYPKITGLSDTTVQDKVNKLLGQIAEADFLLRAVNVDENLKEGVTVKYEIAETKVTYMGNSRMSVRSAGSVVYSNGKGNADFVFCSLINLSTGKEISKKKIYSDFGGIMSLFTSGEFTRVSSSSGEEAGMTPAALMAQYRSYAEYGTYPETWFTADSLVISVELGGQVAGYAEYSVPIQKAAGFLADNPVG